MIAALESAGFRPRIQDGWRSPADQLEAFKSGHSKLEFGFHNVTGATGTKESLAVDLLDDDSPLASRRNYLLRLAAVAEAQGLATGIRWGLPAGLRSAIDEAIAKPSLGGTVEDRLGSHAPRGLTAAEARAGKRPT